MNLDEISKKSIMLSNLINKMPSFVKDHCLIVKFKKGETILEKGEDANKVYIFCTGEIEVKNYFSNGRNYIFSRSKAEKNYFGNIPDFLGSIAIIGEKEKFVSTVIAYKDCITIKISKKFFFCLVT